MGLSRSRFWRRGSPPRNERNARFIEIESTRVFATYNYTYTMRHRILRADRRFILRELQMAISGSVVGRPPVGGLFHV
jgi:hypothetical protein